jgi:hypothetical protein
LVIWITLNSVPFYRGLILSDNYHLPLPPVTELCMWAVGRLSYINTTNEPTGSSNWQFSDKVLTLYKPLVHEGRDVTS